MQVNFGAGAIYAIPAVANPTPVKFGVLKEISLDISLQVKELRGAYIFPVDIANGAGKISGKVKHAQIDGGILSLVLAGSSAATGLTKGVDNESWPIPGTPFAVTVTNSATWARDMGVLNVTTGKIMTRVATGATPATGEYKVAAGVYTFATADTTNTVLISYAHTVAGAAGTTITYTNQLMGAGSTYGVEAYFTYGGNSMGFRLPACKFSKLALPFKSEDYLEQDLDFDAFADSAGIVGYFFLKA